MSPPPPSPPPSSGEEIMNPHASMYNTPPQKHKQSYGYGYSYGYMARRRTANAGTLDAKTPLSSPATSASSVTSPSHLHKTRSASELLSPRVRGRMDPYPRHSPRKRLSADFSDGTYSADSGANSPKSEKGGWRIHAAVHGPFLTGPLAKDFAARIEDLMSPRASKKNHDQDFDGVGMLLFPVVPDYVAPAITPEVFQASIQPTATPLTQPQPEPDHATQQQNGACFYSDNNNYDNQTSSLSSEQQYYQEDYQQQQYYQEGYQQQEYYQHQLQSTTEDLQQQQYYQQSTEDYYYNNGYDQQVQQHDQYHNGYGYEQQQAYPTNEPVAVAADATSYAMEPPSADAFPPLVSPSASATETETVEEPVEAVETEVQRSRAPSYADIVTGAAHSPPRKHSDAQPVQAEVTEAPAAATVSAPAPASPKKTAAPSFDVFSQLSDGIAESMNHILTKSKYGKTSHAEVEFTCVVRRIQTQLKLMGKVSSTLHLEQMKTMHKLQKSEIEKLSLESANLKMQQQIKQFELDQQDLKTQLAEALAAKDKKLELAVDKLTQRINGLTSTTDASTSKLASDITALRGSSGSEDLEMRVEKIGQVLDSLMESHAASGASSSKTLARRPSQRQSTGSWKSVALCGLVVGAAASLSGAWVGVQYAGQLQQLTGASQPLVLQEAAVEAILSQMAQTVPAAHADVEVVEDLAEASVVETVIAEEPRELAVSPVEKGAVVDHELVDIVIVADIAIEHIAEDVVEVAVAADLSSAAAVVDFVEASSVSSNWNTVIAAANRSAALVEEARMDLVEEVAEVEASPVEDDVVVEAEQETVEAEITETEVVEAEITEAEVVEVEVTEVESAEAAVVEAEVTVVEADEAEIAEVEAVAAGAEVIEAATEVEDAEVANDVQVTVEAVEPQAEAVEPVEATVVEEVVVAAPRAVASDACKPSAQALYAWCPSLYDLPADAKAAVQPSGSSSPLNGLARALDSLSTHILVESSPSELQIETVQEEEAELELEAETTPVVPVVQEVVPVVEESSEDHDDVSGSVIELADAEAAEDAVAPATAAVVEEEIVEVAETVESVQVVEEEVVSYANSTASISFETPAVDAFAFSAAAAAVEESPVVVDAVVTAAVEDAEVEESSRWAQEQFLVEIGASCALNAAAASAVVASPVEELVLEELLLSTEPVVTKEWLAVEELFTFSNASSAAVVVADKPEMCTAAPVVDF